jgi:protein-tyrosine phosphatase
MESTIYSIDVGGKSKLGIMARPRGGDWLADDISSVARQGFDVMVSLLEDDETEQLGLREQGKICTEHGVRFIRIPILDRDVPSLDRETLAAISALNDLLSAGKAVVVHCRMAFGRAPMIAACLMIFQGWESERALNKISEARGFAVPETEEQRQWIHKFEQTIRAQKNRE